MQRHANRPTTILWMRNRRVTTQCGGMPPTLHEVALTGQQQQFISFYEKSLLQMSTTEAKSGALFHVPESLFSSFSFIGGRGGLRKICFNFSATGAG